MVLYAKDILETEFLTMPPQRSVFEAAKAMAARRHGFAIVMSPDGKPIGIVTEWDILAKVVAPGRNPADVRLQDVMTPTLVSVDANEDIDRVAKLMAQDGTRRVLVTQDGKLLGVIRVQTILACMRDYIDSIRCSDRAGSAPDFLIGRRSVYAGRTSVKPAGAGPSERGSNSGGPGIGPS